MQTVRYYCQISVKFEYSGQIFEESSIIKCLDHQSSGIGVVRIGGLVDRQTERHNEGYSRRYSSLAD
jgi:hypothetical protein